MPPPLQQKHNVKICFSPFQEALHNFLFLKKKCSWKQPRNAFLDDLQEHAPGQVLGTYSFTLLECWVFIQMKSMQL